MKVAVWNCRGAGGPLTIPQLKEVLNFHSPNVVFLSETKNQEKFMRSVQRKISFEKGYVVNSIGKAGGMALYWNNGVTIDQISHTDWYILACIKDKEVNSQWWLMCVHASTDSNIRKEQWKHIAERKKDWGEAWLLVGDFNDLQSNGEKWGGRVRAESSFKDFNSFIGDNGLLDIGYKGLPWTWSNYWEGEGVLKERLDRGLCSAEWLQWFDRVMCTHIENDASDHAILMVDTNPEPTRKKRRFYFDQRWTKNPEMKEVIQGAWRTVQTGSRMYKMVRKIKAVRVAILEWRRKVQGNSKVKIKELKEKLKQVKEGHESGIKSRVTEIKNQLSKAYKEEELYWSQKSRSKWLKEGDRNTAYFHTTVKAKRRRNTISTLEKQDGTWCKTEEEIEVELSQYYKDLFTTTNPADFEEILKEISCTISRQMNEKLIKPVEEKDIRQALFSMHPNKAPGQDGRQILDNVVVAHEVMHFLKNKRKRATGYMAIKLDMSKAYDRVEWIFVGRMMLKMGFCPIFVKWIMACLSTVIYSFNLNGQKVGYVKPSRGIRQGDPLSPYIFIICAEGLSSIIHKAVQAKELTGVKICRDSPVISHLFFADDSLLCCKATKREALKVKSILTKYGNASGQVVNFEKSTLFFSKNTKERIKQAISEGLDNMKEAVNGTYLGLPMAIGRSKAQVFAFVKNKISSKLQGWKQRLLSEGGKEVLIKAVTMAMPTYVMACFRLPKGLCRDITRKIAKFWWGKGEREASIHWASWKKLSEVKGRGGIGFRDLEAFNTALLAKQIWRFLTAPNLLVSKVMKAKYMKDPNWMNKSPPGSASWSWKSIHSATKLLFVGLWKRIGDGRTVSIWNDKWLIGSEDGKVETAKPEGCNLSWVSELIEDGRWKIEILQTWFGNKEAEIIQRIPTSIGRRKDKLIWKFSKTGAYTVKIGYAMARQEENQISSNRTHNAKTSWEVRKRMVWKNLWHQKVKAKLKHFMWKCLQNCLPTNEVIFKRIERGEGRCSCCGEGMETIEHLLFFCVNAMDVWKLAPVRWDGLVDKQHNLWLWWEEAIKSTSKDCGPERVSLTINLFWQIWKARNRRVFDNEFQNPPNIVSKAQVEWLDYEQAREEEIEQSATDNIREHQTRRQAARDDDVCLFTDAAILARMIRMGQGIVARKWNGMIMKAKAIVNQYKGEPMKEEALAIRNAMLMAKQVGWTKIKIHSDSKSVLDQIHRGNEYDVNIATILEDVQDLTTHFERCSFVFIPRTENEISHALAKFAIQLVDDIQWEQDFLVWLMDLVRKQMRMLKFIVNDQLITVFAEDDCTMIINSGSNKESSRKSLNSFNHIADIVSVIWASKERTDTPETSVMMAKEMIQGEYEIGKGFRQNLQGILESIELPVQKDTFGIRFQSTAKDKKEMQARKKAKKEGKQIVMSIPPLHYTFPRSSGIILSELDEENQIDEVEESLSQLFVGTTYKSEPSENLEFSTILERTMQN
ncbi:uncharacterized protein LOC113766338 [Coffea eugenioides]|uniref:uncharacterized protein LOC113766338 n=1 Tax=Coffea eugenioides TaxID=49369 RepID=UPI000F605B0D|nr:uncharacterized protein LOC113766338 [Coffea eugenioides]